MTSLEAQFANMPDSVKLTAAQRQAVIAHVLAQVQALWGGRWQDPEKWFDTSAELFTALVAQAQRELVILAGDTIDTQLYEQGYREPIELTVNPEAFAEVSGDGRPVMGHAYVAASRALAMPEPTTAAWAAAGAGLLLAVQTVLSDTSREAKRTQLGARKGAGWIRLARPPCCSRCAILAGKTAQGPWVGFRRHPNCDCDAVAVHNYRSASKRLTRKGWVMDTEDYFHSLPVKDQDRIFTKAGAQAIRDGADPAQVVNARRGMYTATDQFGIKTRFTDEGTTKRGWASHYLRTSYNRKLEKRGGRYSRTVRRRLMPEEIYAMAGQDQDEAVWLLHANGYLTDTSPTLSGRAVRDPEVRAARDRTFERLLER